MVLDQEKRTCKQAAYRIESCAIAPQPIEKGSEITLWEGGPSHGKYRRWVHAGCQAAEQPGNQQLDTAQIEQIVKAQVGGLIDKMDLSELEQALEGGINSKMLAFCEQMAAATSEGCGALAEAVQAEMTSTLTRVQELCEAGIKHVHEIKVGDLEISMGEEVLHPAFDETLQLAIAREEIFIPGPAGCGKSHLAKQINTALCKLSGQPGGFSEPHEFGFISCSAGMSEGQLLGRLIPIGDGGKFEYVRSDFIRCYEEGGVFLLDELDAADGNVLLVLNAALANGHMAVPNRPERPVANRHPDFVCIAAANTFGRGADRLYVGRNQLDESTNDRFKIGVVPMDYDRALEEKLCPDKKIREMLWKIRDAVAANRLLRIVSTRFMVKAYKMHKVAGWSLDKIKEKLLAGWSADEVRKVS